ncbi:sterol carrier protein domain-containing protein [Yoonia sp. GPGPB17]|uniref:sterol carrier protein domain-containing protein n=1 Tax=Yoonia sp. GPGPB17 TaxID=3026147 RepID=UPI004040852F
MRLHASTLAEVFFGGHRVSYLARAGQIEGPTDVIDRMDLMFLHRNTPVSLEIF